jgi:hypothetical protein
MGLSETPKVALKEKKHHQEASEFAPKPLERGGGL